MAIKVWTDGAPAGLLGRHGRPDERRALGSAFLYDRHAAPARAVSLTMPVRLASWDVANGLAPIFEMNLPEGGLREHLRLRFAKATGRFDDFDLLEIVGRSQIGRVRYTAEDADLDPRVPFQSVDDILAGWREGDLFRHLAQEFAAYSGLSGVQPKVMVRDEADLNRASSGAPYHSVQGATHIIKLWDPASYPELAANEHLCLIAAERAALPVPRHRLSEDGTALVIDRFDLRPDGSYRGLEDFCVLNGKRTEAKYDGSLESGIVKAFRAFARPEPAELEQLFALIAFNCAIRNGDAHLKNFAVTYEEVEGRASLAPVYDVVTTTAYLPGDAMALTLDGSKRWPDPARLRRLGERRCGLETRRVTAVFGRIAEALADTGSDIRAYMRQRSSFAEVGGRMLEAWETGVRESLRG